MRTEVLNEVLIEVLMTPENIQKINEIATLPPKEGVKEYINIIGNELTKLLFKQIDEIMINDENIDSIRVQLNNLKLKYLGDD